MILTKHFPTCSQVMNYLELYFFSLASQGSLTFRIMLGTNWSLYLFYNILFFVAFLSSNISTSMSCQIVFIQTHKLHRMSCWWQCEKYFLVDFPFKELAQVSYKQFSGRGSVGEERTDTKVAAEDRRKRTEVSDLEKVRLVSFIARSVPSLPHRPATWSEAKEDRETKQHMFIWVWALVFMEGHRLN